uniref:Prenyl transferase n=1 Tax=Periglandula ipomoeae TaxID=1037530 RepID=J7FI32_9HYPO|nr:prenyl transferase [Periglandula ipomoeae]
MNPGAWFAGRSAVIDISALLSAFTLGYLVKNTSKYKSVVSQSIDHYGYGYGQGNAIQRDSGGNNDKIPEIPDCPYNYLLGIYGHNHFSPFVAMFHPTLKNEDPRKYALILDIMDAVHLCLILVDDICDNSSKRKNQTTAHLLYGSCETANRAYFVLTKVINRAMKEQPVLGMELLRALELILEGQDMSLVWRRDGLRAFNFQGDESLLMYKRMALLKTGTLFVLLGRLLNDGGNQLDDLLGRFGWYAQLQNDCKNIYSGEYATNKGTVAEDLRNRELSFPVVVALDDKLTESQMRKAFQSQNEGDIDRALEALESPSVKNTCLKALHEAGQGLEKLVAVWGRKEHMHSTV